ncbi:MAG: class I SAM-dependent methyltransferase [Chloroflexi bacterium]|nr:class I SAM-dependent methyltransferase [Chloroflexota bacterium]
MCAAPHDPQPDDAKSTSRDRFSRFAAGYVTSATHAQGHDLDRLLALSEAQPTWIALDIATGGGHTALKLAPHVRRVIATDYALPMLDAARAFIDAQGLENVRYAPADAENLPFAANRFDLVTCRIAAHHFPDAYRFVCESARVLKPGGRLIVQDHLLPDDAQAAKYIEAFERLRDPSHHQAFADYEWRGMCLDAGLIVDHSEPLRRAAKMIPWAERQGCSPAVIERLHILMVQAPEAVAAWMNIQCAGTADAGFDHVYTLIMGRKPA